MKTLTLNGTAYQVCDPAAVSFEEQTLSQEQKMQARQNLGIPEKTYELIEDVTLGEDVTSFVRTADPNGAAYNFSAVTMIVDVAANPNATSNTQIIFRMDGSDKQYMVYHQVSGAIDKSEKTTAIKARNDSGILDYHVISGSSSTISTKSSAWFKFWSNVVGVNLTTYPTTNMIPAGTRIRIYAVRG